MKNSTAGFSLIEVLVAMALFLIASSAVASLMYHSTAHIAVSNHFSQAIVCAQKHLEEIRAQRYEDITNESGYVCTGEGLSFDVAWQVTEDDPGDGMKSILLTVTWTDKGEVKNYEIHTIYTQVTA